MPVAAASFLTPGYVQQASELAHEAGLRVHLDGARIFNAAVALGKDVRELTGAVDTVQFCLSKGLSAPVGSMVCGSSSFISEARRWRKVVGGGMRQAGVLAAAGIEALNTMVDRLADDHRNARRLAEGFSGITGFSIDPSSVETNMVIWDVVANCASVDTVMSRLGDEGVKVLAVGGRQLRAVTYNGISGDDVEEAVARARAIMNSLC